MTIDRSPRWGPFRRREHTGVPADHFPKWRNRFAEVDHQGRITALVADGLPPEDQHFGAIAKSAGPQETTDSTWDGGENEANLDNDDGEAEYREAFAWVDPDKDPDTKAAYAFIHHMVSADGKVGAANVNACSSGIGILNGARGVDVKGAAWADDRQGIYNHLVGHLKDSGVADDDLPKLDDMAAEPPAKPAPASIRRVVTPISSSEEFAAKVAELRARQAEQPDVQRMTVLVASGAGDVEMEMAVRWDPEVWNPYAWDAEKLRFGRKGDFVSTLPDALSAAAGPDMPQIVDSPGGAWHAVLCVEGLKTDEDPSREIVPNACDFPDLPVSLRLQIHDEGGHWGAVTCGRIDSMERSSMEGYNAILGEGVFSMNEHGQIAQLLVGEQSQRFISIDPRAVEVEIIEEYRCTGNPYDPDDYVEEWDWWVLYTSLTIGAATIVSLPALQQAVIAPAAMDLPETPIAVERAQGAEAEMRALAASGVPETGPPAEWFRAPGFTRDDPRLIPQGRGFYACPLTVVEPDASGYQRVYGHAAWWGAEHTGFPGQKVPPPHSPTYAYFMTGSLTTDSDEEIGVGQLTMGCGHADMGLSLEEVRAHYSRAHYDGGYGAVQMADVQAGEDEFGIWVAGCLRPLRSETNPQGPTIEQVRQFRALNLSGDWRKIAGRKHFYACLVVPVAGFPISREAIVAAGASAQIFDFRTRAGLDSSGEVTALVAAGVVQRRPPEERLTSLERQMSRVLEDLYEPEMASRHRRAALARVAEL